LRGEFSRGTNHLDFFWAERHVTASNFHIETSLDFINCGVDVPR
jgi:hypothetical protein